MIMHGTLVVAIPTGDGIVVGADSRLMVNINQGFVDGIIKKVYVPDGLPNFVLTFTGHTRITDKTPEGKKPWEAPLLLSAEQAALDYMRMNSPTAMAPELMVGLQDHLCSTYFSYFSRYRDMWGKLLNKNVCRSIVLHYQEGLSTVASFELHTKAGSIVEGANSSFQRFIKQDQKVILIYGETEYYYSHLMQEQGATLLPFDAVTAWINAKTIGEYCARSAAKLARGIIEATAKVTEKVGGPIDLILIDGKQMPKSILLETSEEYK